MKKLFTALFFLTALSGCTKQALYEVSNDIWCNHMDNTDLNPDEEIFTGERRKAFPEECTYLSFEDYQNQKSELDKAIATKMREANM